MRAIILGLVLAACGPAQTADAPDPTPATLREEGIVVSWNTGCPAEDALYVLDGEPGYTAGYRRAPPGYESARTHLFWVHSVMSDRTYWYGFSIGSGGALAIPQEGPDQRLNPMDAGEAAWDAGVALYPMGFDGVIGYQPPQDDGAGAEAPPLIFAPNLGGLMELSPYFEADHRREDPANAFFRLTECAGRPVSWNSNASLGATAPSVD